MKAMFSLFLIAGIWFSSIEVRGAQYGEGEKELSSDDIGEANESRVFYRKLNSKKPFIVFHLIMDEIKGQPTTYKPRPLKFYKSKELKGEASAVLNEEGLLVDGHYLCSWYDTLTYADESGALIRSGQKNYSVSSVIDCKDRSLPFLNLTDTRQHNYFLMEIEKKDGDVGEILIGQKPLFFSVTDVAGKFHKSKVEYLKDREGDLAKIRKDKDLNEFLSNSKTCFTTSKDLKECFDKYFAKTDTSIDDEWECREKILDEHLSYNEFIECVPKAQDVLKFDLNTCYSMKMKYPGAKAGITNGIPWLCFRTDTAQCSFQKRDGKWKMTDITGVLSNKPCPIPIIEK